MALSTWLAGNKRDKSVRAPIKEWQVDLNREYVTHSFEVCVCVSVCVNVFWVSYSYQHGGVTYEKASFIIGY